MEINKNWRMGGTKLMELNWKQWATNKKKSANRAEILAQKNDHLWPKMVKQSTRNRYPTRNNQEQVKTAIKSEIIQEKHVWFGNLE